ncbi:AAA family ATPase [Pelagicoccus mobilis]|uniref:ATP-binding protein n=1 Tax=Pelagicoccus mobilis TaxID=415221 RepID=A0A934S1F6_9BACT|nr:ATP-binding protein [Pelagicoccus mobilis]MBK1879405.1 ATP-binding protein [Pelagicoccus mobilis]
MTEPKTLYLVTGMPAVGKTTFAEQLASRLSACLVDIDSATESIVQAAMNRITGNPDDRDSDVFKETFRAPIYETLFTLARANLVHTDVVLTGPFTKELHNPNWPAEVQVKVGRSCRVKCVFLHCSAELRKDRLEARGNPRDRAKLETWETHLQYYDTESFPAYPHFAVDTGEPDAFENAVSRGLID